MENVQNPCGACYPAGCRFVMAAPPPATFCPGKTFFPIPVRLLPDGNFCVKIGFVYWRVSGFGRRRKDMAKKKAYDNDSISSLKGADKPGNYSASFSAPTGWRAASTRCSRFSPTPSTRPGGLRPGDHRHPVPGIDPSRWRNSRGLSRGLERKGGAVQLGAGVLRDVRRRQVRPHRGKL